LLIYDISLSITTSHSNTLCIGKLISAHTG